MNRTIAPEHQWPISLDNPVWMHLGAWWVKAASWQAIFGELPDVETTVKALQLLQASGLAYAVEADRRRQYQNSGTLPWQFNEPYPMAACTSAVDYYAQPKPAYYAVARVYEPVHLSAKFPVQAWAGRERFECEVWVSSSLEQACETARLEQAVIGLSGKRYTQSQQPVRVGSNGSYRLGSMEWDLSDLEEDVFFLDLILAGAGGELLAQDRTIFTRTTNLSPLLAAPGTQLEVHQSAETGPRRLTLTNRGEATALFVWLEDCQAETGSVYFSDNYFCLFPGETRLIDVTWDEDSRAPECIEVRGWNFPKEQLWI
ncbi:MAG: hypothetical protein EHM70_25110 [Chloroflexota bacterium]|nr:MAG: hypothetical protein EHM70_25110 [Chloroflexota bacterium]